MDSTCFSMVPENGGLFSCTKLQGNSTLHGRSDAQIASMFQKSHDVMGYSSRWWLKQRHLKNLSEIGSFHHKIELERPDIKKIYKTTNNYY